MSEIGVLQITTAASATANGVTHVYLQKQDGRKVAVVWGPDAEKLERAYQFAAAPMLLLLAEKYAAHLSAIPDPDQMTQLELERAMLAIRYAKGEDLSPSQMILIEPS